MYLIKYILMINKVFKLFCMSGKQIKLLLFVLFYASSSTKILIFIIINNINMAISFCLI